MQTILCYSTPNTHPFISDEEKKFLNQNVESLLSSGVKKLNPTPWKALLRSVPLWALIIAGVSMFIVDILMNIYHCMACLNASILLKSTTYS